MEIFQKQAERFGTEFVYGDVDRGRPLAASVPRRSRRRARTRADTLIIATGATRQAARPPERDSGSWATASRPAPPATASSSRARRWWSSAAATPRWRRRPSSPSSRTKVQRAPPPRGAARVEDHAGARAEESEDRVRVERRGRRGPGRADRAAASPASCSRTPQTGARREMPTGRPLHRHRPRAEHAALRGPARHGRARLHRHRAAQHGHQRARRVRLRRRAGPDLPPGRHGGGHAAAWRRSTPSAGSKRSTA